MQGISAGQYFFFVCLFSLKPLDCSGEGNGGEGPLVFWRSEPELTDLLFIYLLLLQAFIVSYIVILPLEVIECGSFA